jgi:hypothetical protein
MGGALIPRAAVAAANPPGTTKPQGQPPVQNILIKQNDLAAESLIIAAGAGESSDEHRTSLVPVLVGTCRNRGVQTYKPGFRALRLHHVVGETDEVVAASFIPQLGPGKSFTLSYHVPMNEDEGYDLEGYWIEVSEGNRPDENPENDLFVLEFGGSNGLPLQIEKRD